MSLNRIIPLLLIDDNKLVKTKNFQHPQYVGDPKNTIKLFNEMNCSEIILIDIGLKKKKRKIDFSFIESIVSEAFMPVSYGGGIESLEEINNLIKIGCEKISLNFKSYDFLFMENAVRTFGSSTIIVSIDVVRKNDKIFCYNYLENKTNQRIEDRIEGLNKYDIGEYLINFVEKDGMMSGFDQDAIKQILKLTNSQITFCGGASTYKNIYDTFLCGAKSLAAGSLFIYQSFDSGVLINFPEGNEYKRMLEV